MKMIDLYVDKWSKTVRCIYNTLHVSCHVAFMVRYRLGFMKSREVLSFTCHRVLREAGAVTLKNAYNKHVVFSYTVS